MKISYKINYEDITGGMKFPVNTRLDYSCMYFSFRELTNTISVTLNDEDRYRKGLKIE